ncbi:hypothetical protein JCM3775_001483 [Rhodotorula graminis]
MSGADPLQLGSGASTPDSATVWPDWDAVDREIARVSASSSFIAVKSSAAPHLDEEGATERGEDELVEREAAAYGITGAAELHDRLARRRVVLLGCAAVLSVGSHYSTYTLGPIKKSLGTSEGGFAALVSSFEVLNTVSPLLSGFLVPRYGAAACGFVATGAVLVGQLVVCFSAGKEGGVGNNVGWTVLGLLVFGSGTSPLAVVQESIILKHNSASSKFVARSVAAGLVLGKSASFAAGWSSQRLYAVSPRLPFVTAASLAAFSFAACILYAVVERSTSRLVARDARLAIDAADERATRLKPARHDALGDHPPSLDLSSLASFGTPFWWYIAVCVLAGTWYTTQHLATHLLQATYGTSAISQEEASATASVLLGTPILLYPLVGWIVDKHPHLLSTFWLLVPSLTATTFFFLLLLSPAVPPLVALLPAAFGMGSGPLLLVLVVPRIVQRHQAPTALGAHKSLEMAGAILSQTLSAALLSLGSPPSPSSSSTTGAGAPSRAPVEADEAGGAADGALVGLLVAALVQLAFVARWWHAIRVRDGAAARGAGAGVGVGAGGGGGGGAGAGAAPDEAELGLLAAVDGDDEGEGGGAQVGEVELLGRKERLELRRGTRALQAAAGTVVASWACFVWNVVRG